MDDSEIVGDASDAEPPPQQESNRKRRRANAVMSSAGKDRVVIVVSSVQGLWHGEFRQGEESSGADQGDVVVGIVLVAAWTLCSARETPRNADHATMRDKAARCCKSVRVSGFVEYPITCAVRLEKPQQVRGNTMPKETVALVSGMLGLPSSGHPGPGTIGAQVDAWLAQGAFQPCIVRLTPPLAALVVRGQWSCLHAVAISERVNRGRLLVSTEPSAKRIRDWQGSHGEMAEPAPAPEAPVSTSAVVRRPRWSDMLSADLVLDWLAASFFVKSLRQTPAAANAFRKVVLRAGAGAHDLGKNDGEKTMSYETLRTSRVRADCLAMLVWRAFWASLLADGSCEQVDIYLFADSSPQWRGLEMFAASADFRDDNTNMIMRRLLPLVSLERCHMSAMGKTQSLLFQLWLIAGPSRSALRKYCERVRAVVSDFGTERHIVNSRDCMPGFFRLLDNRLQDEPSEFEYLFPRALQVPGWKHLIDNLLQSGLSSMVFFPHWLDLAKAITNFCRSTFLRKQLVKHMQGEGHQGPAEILESTAFVNFAHWRWGTLHAVTKSILVVYRVLRRYFKPAIFEKSRDTTWARKVHEAVSSDKFMHELEFVAWMCNWLCPLQTWASGCKCHEQELREGTPVECDMKGRRMHEAFLQAKMVFDQGLAEAEAWMVTTWDLGPEFWTVAQGCVREVCRLGFVKVRFLDTIPWLLARLPEAGVRDRCIEQYGQGRPGTHHRVSLLFLSPDGPLRSEVDQMGSDGTSMGERLAAEVRGLQHIPLDDGVAEGPHARAARAKQSASGSTWAWIAASLRLQQNLQDIRSMLPTLDLDLDTEWGRYTSVLQALPDRAHRPMRISKADFRNRLYHMSHLGDPSLMDNGCAAQPAEDVVVATSIGQGIEEGEGGQEGVSEVKMIGRSVAWSSQKGPETTTSSITPPQRHDAESRLLREWFASALVPYSYLSVPEVQGNAIVKHHFYQVLGFEKQAIVVETFVPEAGVDKELIATQVQPLQLWGKPEAQQASVLADSVVAFVVEGPCTIDLARLVGMDTSMRKQVKVWSPAASDIEGCVRLTSPQVCRPTCDINDAKAPVLTLVDHLAENGFTGQQIAVTHVSTSRRKVFDSRDLPKKRFYLQCVAKQKQLFRGGLASFRSDGPQAYYKLILRGQKDAPFGLPAKEYARRLAGHDEDELQGSTSTPQRMPASSSNEDPRNKVAAPVDPMDADIIGDDILPLPSPAVPSQGGTASNSGGGGVAAGEAVDVADDLFGDEAREVHMHPTVIEGVPVTLVRGRYDAQWSYFDRLSVKCTNPKHIGCTKSRSTNLQVEVFGPRAAEIFLGVWVRASSTMAASTHRRYQPPVAAMRAYALEIGCTLPA